MLKKSFGLVIAGALGASLYSIPSANAASCYDLWYERNAIYADAGYCFKSSLGKRTFGTACSTHNPRLTRSEQRRVASIKKQERRKGCKVNN